MQITMLKSKVHRAVVTQAELNYVGSITIDSALMEAAGIVEYEQVQVADVENGQRFVTYVIAGDPGSGIICVNGAAAHCVELGDHVIVMAYCQLSQDEAASFKPTVVLVSEDNSVKTVARYERHGELAV